MWGYNTIAGTTGRKTLVNVLFEVRFEPVRTRFWMPPQIQEPRTEQARRLLELNRTEPNFMVRFCRFRFSGAVPD